MNNGNETGPDCGGSCPGCAPGQACNVGNDCTSLVCIGHVCQTETCSDGVQNGGELGVDCGGPCTPCSCVTRGQCKMFVTTASSGGNLGGLAGADATCNTHASAAGLIGVYQAWLCVNGVAPATRSVHANVPYRRTDGALIANNWADLTDGTIASPINRTEAGVDVSATSPFLPWTYVTTAGTCDNEYLSPGSGPLPTFQNCPTNCASNRSNAWTSSSGFAQGSKGDINATRQLDRRRDRPVPRRQTDLPSAAVERGWLLRCCGSWRALLRRRPLYAERSLNLAGADGAAPSRCSH